MDKSCKGFVIALTIVKEKILMWSSCNSDGSNIFTTVMAQREWKLVTIVAFFALLVILIQKLMQFLLKIFTQICDLLKKTVLLLNLINLCVNQIHLTTFTCLSFVTFLFFFLFEFSFTNTQESQDGRVRVRPFFNFSLPLPPDS